jgi:hypothetical protein
MHHFFLARRRKPFASLTIIRLDSWSANSGNSELGYLPTIITHGTQEGSVVGRSKGKNIAQKFCCSCLRFALRTVGQVEAK